MRNWHSASAIKKASAFGCALSTIFMSSEIQADVLDITWEGGNAEATVPSSDQRFVDMDQIDGEGMFGDMLVRNNLSSISSTLVSLRDGASG